MSAHTTTPAGRPRARGLGIPFSGTPGTWNAITDVPGVEVGYATLIEGDAVRTGVTAIHPRGAANVGDACMAAVFSLNGNGELTGSHWIEEAGTLPFPITITNTHAVGPAHRGTIEWVVDRFPDLGRLWLLPVTAETWDGYLNDINGPHVTPAVARAALDSAASGPLDEGCVGGGTGMNCYAFKGGTGTASRRVDVAGGSYAVGVLLQCNFGSRHELVIAGVPLGEALADDNPMEDTFGDWIAAPGAGSVISVVATDAPLLPGQLKALARRVPLGLARTGTTGGHYSGDIFLAFSTANAGAVTGPLEPLVGDVSLDTVSFVPWGAMDVLYAAVAHAVEEAVVNALVAAEEMVGRDGHRSPGLPHDRVVELLRARGAIA